jgi:hypothetical protein
VWSPHSCLNIAKHVLQLDFGFITGRDRPILLKKSAMVCASKKYASEIEIFTFGRSIRTRISRSSVQKRRFHQSMIRQFGQTDFFNRIGQKLPFMNGSNGQKGAIVYGETMLQTDITLYSITRPIRSLPWLMCREDIASQ